jgi:hypothetical protein
VRNSRCSLLVVDWEEEEERSVPVTCMSTDSGPKCRTFQSKQGRV